MDLPHPPCVDNVVQFPTPDERKLARLSEHDRLRAEQVNKIYWHARHLLETITMERDGFNRDAYVSSRVLEITKFACSQAMAEMATEYRRLTGEME